MITTTQEGDFVELLESHKKIIFKISNLYSPTSEDKKDLAQEIILQLWKAFPKYDNTYALSTWVYRIALNVSISFYRKYKTRNKTHKNYTEFYDLIHWEEKDIEPKVQKLYKMIENLKSLDKAIIILFLEGHKNPEIAKVMGMSSSNVSTRLNRIKEQLNKMYYINNK